MNMSGFGLPPQGTLKQLLRSHIITAIQFDYPSIVERVGIARKCKFGAQAGFGNCKVSAGAGGDFGDRGILLDQRPKSITSLCEMAPRKFFVRSFKSLERGC